MLVYASGLPAYVPFLGIFKLERRRPYKNHMENHQNCQKRCLSMKNGDTDCYQNQPRTTFKRARILP